MAKRVRKNETVENQDVDQAIAKLLEAHNDGKQLANDFPKYERQGTESERVKKANLWKSLDFTNEDQPRKLRQFADPVAGYTEKELDELWKLCRDKQHVPGLSFIYKLLTIPKQNGQRKRFQRELITNRWTRKRVDREIQARFGRRRQGGKKPPIPESLDEVVAQVESMCFGWRRWYDQIDAIAKKNKKEFGKADLPKPLRDALEETDDAIKNLNDAIQHQLAKQRRK